MNGVKLFCKGEVLEFKWMERVGYYDIFTATNGLRSEPAKTGICHLKFTDKGEVEFYDCEWEPIHSLNPTHLEHIDEEDCPECEGTGRHSPDWYNKALNYMPHERIAHQDCKGTGKVEVVTQKTFFGYSLTEYVHEQITGFLKVCVKTDKEEHGYFGSLEFMEKVVEELKEDEQNGKE